MIDDLIGLAHQLGTPENDLAILAEGNCSEGVDEQSFLVKASGSKMATAAAEDFALLRREPVVAALDQDLGNDQVVRGVLDRARSGDTGASASTEAFMHAWLLGLPGIRYVGHTHPTSLLALLSTQDAKRIAEQRLFPDEIVCCGPSACFVDYTMPGLPLARAVRTAVDAYAERLGILPKTIWLQNHGLITLGGTPAEVVAASLMSAKAAKVWLGALATGHPIRTLSDAEIDQIYRWPDEHYRQRKLWS